MNLTSPHTINSKSLIWILGLSDYVNSPREKMVKLFANSGDPDQIMGKIITKLFFFLGYLNLCIQDSKR